MVSTNKKTHTFRVFKSRVKTAQHSLNPTRFQCSPIFMALPNVSIRLSSLSFNIAVFTSPIELYSSVIRNVLSYCTLALSHTPKLTHKSRQICTTIPYLLNTNPMSMLLISSSNYRKLLCPYSHANPQYSLPLRLRDISFFGIFTYALSKTGDYKKKHADTMAYQMIFT